MKKKRGNSLGFKIFDFYLSIGIKHAYALLYFVALHYLLFDRKAVKATGKYIDARFKSTSFLSRLKHTYKIFINNGKNLIDLRQLERNPEKVKMTCDTSQIRELLSQKKGLLIFMAHVGNWQVMMRNLPALDVKINIVMLPEENPVLKEYLNIDNGKKLNINIINPSKGVDAVLEIMKELSSGNIVSLMGDRILENSKIIKADFFGKQTKLPEGPYHIASAIKSPVLFLLPRRKGPCDYTLEVNEMKIKNNIKDRKTKTLKMVSQYTKILENFLKLYPYEWSPAGDI